MRKIWQVCKSKAYQRCMVVGRKGTRPKKEVCNKKDLQHLQLKAAHRRNFLSTGAAWRLSKKLRKFVWKNRVGAIMKSTIPFTQKKFNRSYTFLNVHILPVVLLQLLSVIRSFVCHLRLKYTKIHDFVAIKLIFFLLKRNVKSNLPRHSQWIPKYLKSKWAAFRATYKGKFKLVFIFCSVVCY